MTRFRRLPSGNRAARQPVRTDAPPAHSLDQLLQDALERSQISNVSLGAGETVEQILGAHPRLTMEGVRAALRYAAEVLKTNIAYPLESLSR